MSSSRAVAVRAACIKLIEHVTEQLSEKKDWEPALLAAPAAICVMATCLVASLSDEAGSIRVDCGKTDAEGKLINLPYEHLAPNLQHCTNLGRLAFNDAQASMQRLQDRARSMIRNKGTIAQIVELLDHPEEARRYLPKEIGDLQTAAGSCKHEADCMRESFENLLFFIMNLQEATITAKVANSEDAQKNAAQAVRQKDEEEKFHEELRRVGEEMEALRGQLTKAREDEEAAQSQLDEGVSAHNKPRIRQLTQHLEEIEVVEQKMAGMTWISSVVRKLLRYGESPKAKKSRDLTKQLLEKEIKRLRSNEEIAPDAPIIIEQTRNRIREIEQELKICEDRVRRTRAQRCTTEEAIKEANTVLQRLAQEHVNLETIHKIIRNAIQALQRLKEHIDVITDFFTGLSDNINFMDNAITEWIDSIKVSGDGLDLTESRKRRLIERALDIQSQCSVMGDIARVYVLVSVQYIKPGMNRMEQLANLSKEEYSPKQVQFEDWSTTAVLEIDELAKKETIKMRDTMAVNVALLANGQMRIRAA